MRPKLLLKLGFAPLCTEPSAATARHGSKPSHRLPTNQSITTRAPGSNAHVQGADRTGTPPAPGAGAVRYPDPRTPRAARPTPAQNSATASWPKVISRCALRPAGGRSELWASRMAASVSAKAARCGLNQRHQRGRRRQGQHQLLRADRLHPAADVAHELRRGHPRESRERNGAHGEELVSGDASSRGSASSADALIGVALSSACQPRRSCGSSPARRRGDSDHRLGPR